MVDAAIFAILAVLCAIAFDRVRDAVAPGSSDGALWTPSGLAEIAAWVIAAVVTIGWYAVWQSATGSSPGMKVLRLRVVGPVGEKPTLLAAAIRNAPAVLASFGHVNGDATVDFAPWFLPTAVWAVIGLSIARSPRRQGFHDRMAGGTLVLQRAASRPRVG